MTKTKIDIFDTFDAPWLRCEFEVPAKDAELQKRRFGVEDGSGETLAMHLTDKMAQLIARAPEMLALTVKIAKDDTSKYQHEAQIILQMMGWTTEPN
jgi:hypothetical protein